MNNTGKQSGNSAQAYLDLCENAPIGIFRTTAKGKIISANTAVARMLKFHSTGNLIEEVNRINVAEALLAEPERWREITGSVLAYDGWRTFEEGFRCRDGTIITCALYLRAAGENEERVEIHGFIEDISERKQSENSLRLSQFIIDNACIGIFRGDPNGNIVYVNKHGAKALGYTRQELCAMSFFDIVPNFKPGMVDSTPQKAGRQRFEHSKQPARASA
jgi:PAS domain S-box-containing protein